MVAHRREHAPHLVVAALGDRQPRAALAQLLEQGRTQRRLLRFEHQRAAGEQRDLVPAQRRGQVRLVGLGQVGARRDDPVQQLAVVGHQQQAAGVAIEAADRGQHRIAQPEARRQQVVDQAAGVLGRAGIAHRLVQHQRHAGRGIQRFAVDAHGRVHHRVVGVQHLAIGVGDAPLPEHPGHLLAAAVAKVGDVAQELHRRAPRRASRTRLIGPSPRRSP